MEAHLVATCKKHGPVVLGCGVARVCGIVCFCVAGGCVVYPASPPLWPCGGPAVLAIFISILYISISIGYMLYLSLCNDV